MTRVMSLTREIYPVKATQGKQFGWPALNAKKAAAFSNRIYMLRTMFVFPEDNYAQSKLPLKYYNATLFQKALSIK